MRRSLTVLLSLGLVLGLGAIRSLVAQDEEPAPAPAATTPEASQEADAPQEAPADAPEADAPSASASTGDLPSDVQQKREAALKAVAELIVAAERAGLVQTNVDPPPVLDILVLGRASDKADLEAAKSDPEAQVGLVNPEAFAAYFTGYAEPPEGLTAQANVRIRQPSEGLKEFFDRRAEALRPYLEAARNGSQPETPAEPSADEPAVSPEQAESPAEEPKAEAPAPEEPKEEPQAETPAEEPKAEEPAADEPQADEPADEPQG